MGLSRLRPERRGASLATGLALCVLALGLPSLLAGGCVIPERTFEADRPDCESYCDAIEEQCTSERAVYSDRQQCIEVCKALPPGNDGANSGNSIACRLGLLRAPGFEDTLCSAVGPIGNGRCGSNCEAFCMLRRAACGEVETFELEQNGYCEESCAQLTNLETYGVGSYDNADTLQCRVGHVAIALGSPEQTRAECQSSRIVPQVPQSYPCLDSLALDPDDDREIYCRLVQHSCTGERAVYDGMDQCMDTAQTFTVGNPADTEANTLRCRRYHAYAAFEVPEQHCTHAGPTGDGHCAIVAEYDQGNCISYCKIARDACPSGYASEFNPTSADDIAGCVQSCTALSDAPRDGFVNDPRYSTTQPAAPQSGPLKCRTLHAVRALEARDGPECAAAFAEPGSACDPDLLPSPL